jgi:NAD(P)-dependent dehydrogenase (short-subunit alcohol dehydrogenase family)
MANRRVLIVGGSSGMGLALARRCLDAGAQVLIAGRNEDRLNCAREELGNPAALDTVAVDITREDQVAALFRRIGRLDHIVSTAADIEGAYELLPALELKAAQRVVESKFYGPLLLAKHGAPLLSATGSITFTSGIAAYRPAARRQCGAGGARAGARHRTGADPGQRSLAWLGRHADLEFRCRRPEG